MTPKNVEVLNLNVVKAEELKVFRQHARIPEQELVESAIIDVCRAFRAQRATGDVKIVFNGGGCSAIYSEQVTTRELLVSEKTRA